MKNFLTQLALATLLAFSLSTTAHAAPITGNITFTGDLTLNNANFTAASGVTSFTNTKVNQADGAFAGIVSPGDAVVFTAPWMFNSGVVAPFWQVDGFTFNLTGSFVTFHDDASISVKGMGWLSGNGFDLTAGTWNFSTQNIAANGKFSFSASSKGVPDNGTTAALLGVSLIGLSIVARRKVR
ncbi:MAG: VPDSG-CTERM sorting domain-containing protein [Opitutus sp.]